MALYIAIIYTGLTCYHFIPELCLSQRAKLEVVENMKLVGYQVCWDLSTKAKTKYIVSQAWERIWIIQQLKALGACEADLLNVLRCQVLRKSPAVCCAGLDNHVNEGNSIEYMQKTALYLIYGARLRSYTWALGEANLKTQFDQRKTLFEQFTRSCINSKKFSKWFCRADNEQGVTIKVDPEIWWNELVQSLY